MKTVHISNATRVRMDKFVTLLEQERHRDCPWHEFPVTIFEADLSNPSGFGCRTLNADGSLQVDLWSWEYTLSCKGLRRVLRTIWSSYVEEGWVPVAFAVAAQKAMIVFGDR